jgi:hypothetical protein
MIRNFAEAIKVLGLRHLPYFKEGEGLIHPEKACWSGGNRHVVIQAFIVI